MNALRNFLPLSIAAFLLLASSMTGSFGCSSSSSSHNDGGVGGTTGGGAGGSAIGTGGSAAGTGGSAAGTGGHGGVTGADAGIDVLGGAGGTIVIPDGGNNFTCADLLACCNSGTGVLMTMCLNQYNLLMPMGNTACGNFLAGIKANSNLCP